MDSVGWIPRKLSDSEGKQGRKLPDSEGKQGRKQLLKHFIPVLVHDYSKQQWRNSSDFCYVLAQPFLGKKMIYLHACQR